MAQSGRKTIKIEAPIMIIEGTPVWMDKNWPVAFFDWLIKNGFQQKLSGMTHLNNKIKLTFIDSKTATMFGLKYDTKKIF